MTEQSPGWGWREVRIVLGALLVLLALALVGLSRLFWEFLASAPSPEEGDQCIGGGHAAYGALILALAGLTAAAAVATLVQAVRGHRVRVPALLTLGLLAGTLALWVGAPIPLDMNVGQC